MTMTSPTPLHAMQHDPMEDLRVTVQRITEDLNSLMRRLSGTDHTEARELVEQMLNDEIFADFKISVDAMRHLLWIYIEAVSNAGAPVTLVQSARLQKAVDMLRALHGSELPEQFAGAQTFIEHVQKMVDGYGVVKKKKSA